MGADLAGSAEFGVRGAMEQKWESSDICSIAPQTPFPMPSLRLATSVLGLPQVRMLKHLPA